MSSSLSFSSSFDFTVVIIILFFFRSPSIVKVLLKCQYTNLLRACAHTHTHKVLLAFLSTSWSTESSVPVSPSLKSFDREDPLTCPLSSHRPIFFSCQVFVSYLSPFPISMHSSSFSLFLSLARTSKPTQ